MISIADQLRTQRDFNTLRSIVNGLQSDTVSTYLAGLGGLDSETAQLLSGLATLCDSAGDFFALRRSANIFAGPAVPSLDIYLSDLASLPTSDFVSSTSTELIDIDYFRLIHAHLDHHRRLSSLGTSQTMLGSSSYVLRLHTQGLNDNWTSARTGPMDALSMDFEQDLLHAWTKYVVNKE